MRDAWKMAVYGALPVRLQEAALSLYARSLDGLYYGNGYEQWRQRFIRRQNHTRAEIVAEQNRQLQQIIQVAATNVPFYRQAWRRTDWRAVRSTADLSLLPRLEKQSLRQNEEAFVGEGVDLGRVWMETTGGTAGTALRIYWPVSSSPQGWAWVEVTARSGAKVGRRVPRAMMGGRPVVRGDAGHPPYWRFNRRWRQLYLSS